MLRNRFGLNYSIFTHHTRFQYLELKQTMPEDTMYITILRDPVRLFESLFHYASLAKNLLKDNYRNETFEQFVDLVYDSLLNQTSSKETRTELTTASAANVNLWDSLRNIFRLDEQLSLSNDNENKFNANKRYRGRFGRNQMAFDLGFNSNLFDDPIYVKQLISNMEKIFNLVLIAEKFDESLILLQEQLCWPSLEDVAAFKHNSRIDEEKSAISSDTKFKLRKINQADKMIYDHFSKIFDERVSKYGASRMRGQVRQLRSLTKKLYSKVSVL